MNVKKFTPGIIRCSIVEDDGLYTGELQISMRDKASATSSIFEHNDMLFVDTSIFSHDIRDCAAQLIYLAHCISGSVWRDIIVFNKAGERIKLINTETMEEYNA